MDAREATWTTLLNGLLAMLVLIRKLINPYTGVDGTSSTTKEENKAVSIDEYDDVGETEGDLLCAAVRQPISVGMDGSAWDFQLYTGSYGDYLGVSAKKRKMAHHKLSWTKEEQTEKTYQPLQWKMNRFAATR